MVSAETLYITGVVAAVAGYYHMKGSAAMNEGIGNGALDELDNRLTIPVASGVGVAVGAFVAGLLPVSSTVVQYAIGLGVVGFLTWNHLYTTYVSGKATLVTGRATRFFLRTLFMMAGGAVAGYKNKREKHKDSDDD